MKRSYTNLSGIVVVDTNVVNIFLPMNWQGLLGGSHEIKNADSVFQTMALLFYFQQQRKENVPHGENKFTFQTSNVFHNFGFYV